MIKTGLHELIPVRSVTNQIASQIICKELIMLIEHPKNGLSICTIQPSTPLPVGLHTNCEVAHYLWVCTLPVRLHTTCGIATFNHPNQYLWGCTLPVRLHHSISQTAICGVAWSYKLHQKTCRKDSQEGLCQHWNNGSPSFENNPHSFYETIMLHRRNGFKHYAAYVISGIALSI